MRINVTIGGESHTTTWDVFVADNADGLGDADVVAIRAALDRGETWHGGGGAHAEWSIGVLVPRHTALTAPEAVMVDQAVMERLGWHDRNGGPRNHPLSRTVRLERMAGQGMTHGQRREAFGE